MVEFDRLKTGSDANCKKGMPCGNSCISKSKKCRKDVGTAVAAVVDHVTDPPNLEQGAGSSGDTTNIQNAEFVISENLEPIGETTESQQILNDFKKWEAEQKEPESNKTLAQKLNPESPPPTEDQAKAINAYTLGAYRDVNGLLRNSVMFGSSEQRQKAISSADKISDGVQSLPDHKGETYRGTALDKSAVAKMEVGGTFSDKGFFSTSSSKITAEKFTDNDSQKIPVFFTVDGKSGKDISAASKFKEEKEILFDRASEFTINSIEEKSGVLHVRLKQ